MGFFTCVLTIGDGDGDEDGLQKQRYAKSKGAYM